MSKTSISRDRWRQLGQSNYRDWCPGCGLYAHVNAGQHRGDCTAGLHARSTLESGATQ